MLFDLTLHWPIERKLIFGGGRPFTEYLDLFKAQCWARQTQSDWRAIALALDVDSLIACSATTDSNYNLSMNLINFVP